jgi:hypothetical protein
LPYDARSPPSYRPPIAEIVYPHASADCRENAARLGWNDCGDAQGKSPLVGGSCCGGKRGEGQGRSKLIEAGAWIGSFGRGMEIVVGGSRMLNLVVRKGVGEGLEGWGLVALVDGSSRFADGISLRWRCWSGSGWFRGGGWRAGRCLLVGEGMTLLLWMAFLEGCRGVDFVRRDSLIERW